MDVPFVLTRELQLNQRTVELLSSKKQVIVFGHIGHMPIPETDEQVTLKSKIIQMLYFNCNLIMPYEILRIYCNLGCIMLKKIQSYPDACKWV